MKIKIKKPVSLDIEGVQRTFYPSDKIIEIDNELAKKRDYEERYGKYSDHIEIIEGVDEETKDEVKPTRKRTAKKADKE